MEDEPEARAYEAKAAFHLALRARGVRDLAVLRAMERVPRQPFADPRHAALVARDLAVPIGGGQTASPAWLIAAFLEAAEIAPGQRVLEVGAGSGYGTAILGQLGAAVLALERVRSLAAAARACLDAVGVAGVELRWADGSAGGEGDGRFDRIIVHACCERVPEALFRRLAGDGVLVCARPTGTGQGLARIAAGEAEGTLVPVQGCRLPPLRSGRLDL